jgi:hypothetical protein
LTEINKNPNNPEDVPSSFLIVGAIRAVALNTVSGAFNYNMTGLWAQHFSQTQYPDEGRYKFRPGDIDGYFNNFYTTGSKNLVKIIEKDASPNFVATAKILKAYHFMVGTDAFGDMPYSEAFQADKEQAILAPKYDSQKEIYTAIFAELKEAVALIDDGAAKFGKEDLIYKGDMAKWKKFANSLRMRAAMRLQKVDPALAQAEFEAAVAAGPFTSNADNAVLWYFDDPDSRHPQYTNRLTRNDHSVSKTLVDIMTNGDATGRDLARHDPRLAIYAQRTAGDTAAVTYRGHEVGLAEGHGVPLSAVSEIGTRWRQKADGDAQIMGYAEVLFLRAEAAQRGWNAGGGTAAEYYRDGIKASMTYYGISEAVADAYLPAHPELALTAGDGPLAQIAIQKWIALYQNGTEAYSDWRRTGYPKLVAGRDALNGGKILRRVPYPGNEQTLNKANLEAAIAAQGLSGHGDMNTPVWWDKQ